MDFVLYGSSAGSGKTYTLVKEYLQLVLREPEKYKQVLAMTFTNKAAAEMKERILSKLNQLANKEDEELLHELDYTFHTQVKLPVNIPVAAAQLQTQLLHSYSDFAILTIDSFIHKVLRAFALEVDLPLSFNVELNYDRIYSFVVDRLLNSVGRDPVITETIFKYVNQRMYNNASWLIEGNLRKFVQMVLAEQNSTWTETLEKLEPEKFQIYWEAVNSTKSAFIKVMKELCGRAAAKIEDSGIDVNDFIGKSKGIGVFFRNAAGALDEKLETYVPPKDMWKEDKWSASKLKKAEKEAVHRLGENFLGTIRRDIIEHYETNYCKALTADFILQNLHLATIVSHIKKIIKEYRDLYNLVPIGEFNIKVHEIVEKSPVPFIYEMLGDKYTHYLIDEFQDTSRLQWENLSPLIENAWASGYFNMVVGDGKQSIYRWRGSDVEIMENLKKNLPIENVKNLSKNFRSQKYIVQFNNEFFSRVRDTYQGLNDQITDIYKECAQALHLDPQRPKDAGWVSMRFLDDVESDEDADQEVFFRTKEIIHDCMERGGYKEQDIAVLVRAKKEGRKIAEFLLKHDIKVVSPDSMMLREVPVIRFLVNVLTYLNHPADKIAKASIIYYFSRYRKKDPLSADRVGTYFMPPEDQRSFPEDFPQFNEFFRKRKFLIRMPVYEVVEEIIRFFRLQDSLDFQSPVYLQAFLDIAADYSRDNNVDFSSFLDWWESSEEEFCLEMPEQTHAVTIMTIHKAKGLEFPVVIVPYAQWVHRKEDQLWLTPEPTQFGLAEGFEIPLPVSTKQEIVNTSFASDFEKEMQRVTLDHINMLYVAFTRAVDHLYIMARQKSNANNNQNDEHAVSRGPTNYQLLKDICTKILEEDDRDENHYYDGMWTVKRESVKKESKNSPMEKLISTPWYKKITIRKNAVEFWRFDQSYREEKKKWGIMVHQVMSRILSSNDLQRVVTAALNSGEIETAEQAELIKNIEELFRIPQVSDWFDPKHQVFSEAPIITDSGILRPDRVVITEDEVIIVDFKTGGRHNSHHWQLLKYKTAIMAMGYKNVAAFILYLESKEIVEV